MHGHTCSARVVDRTYGLMSTESRFFVRVAASPLLRRRFFVGGLRSMAGTTLAMCRTTGTSGLSSSSLRTMRCSRCLIGWA